MQIETFRGQTDTLAIRWINDCEYILENVWPYIYNAEPKAEFHVYYGMDYIFDEKFKLKLEKLKIKMVRKIISFTELINNKTYDFLLGTDCNLNNYLQNV